MCTPSLALHLIVLVLAHCRADEDITIEQVAAGLQARDALIKSCAFRLSIQAQRRSLTTGVLHEYAVANEIQLDRALGRFRWHLHGQAVLGPSPVKNNQEYLAVVDELNVFDGARTRSYSRFPTYDDAGNETDRFVETAYIYGKKWPNWIINPEDLINSHNGANLAAALTRGSWTVGDRDGDLIVLHNLPKERPNDKPAIGAYKLWFDTKKGFAPARKQSLILREGDRDWVMFFEGSVQEWTDVLPDLWLPAKYTEFFETSPPGKAATLDHRYIAEITYSDINREFDAETFKLKFPPGITVVDSERGTSYKTAAITDATLDADARQAVALRDAYLQTKAALEARQKAAWPSWAWPAIAASAVAIVGLAALFVVKAAKRPPAGGHFHA